MSVTHLRGRSSSLLTSTTDPKYFSILPLKSFFNNSHCSALRDTNNTFVSHCCRGCYGRRAVPHNHHDWLVCLSAEQRFRKINLNLKYKRFFFCSIIFTFCVEIFMPIHHFKDVFVQNYSHTHTHTHPVSEGLKISPSIVSAQHCS